MNLRRIGRALLSGLIILIIGVGVPVALAMAVGWPLPTFVPSPQTVWSSLQASDVPDVVIVKTLAVIIWLAWVQIIMATVIELVCVLQGRLAHRIRGFGLSQALASFLVAGLLMINAPRVSSAPQPLKLVLAVNNQDQAQPSTTQTATVAAVSVNAPTFSTYTVKRRDNLWNIAGSQLGDPARWPEIFAANKGKVQADGRSLQQPELIHPGWTLQIPSPGRVGPSVNVGPTNTAAVNPIAPVTPVPDDAASKAEPSSTTTTTIGVQSAVGSAESTNAETGHSETRFSMDESMKVVLASGSVIGIGLASAISTALVTARLRRRRWETPESPLADMVTVDESIPSDLRAVRQAVLDADLEGAPMVDLETGTIAVGHDGANVVNIDLAKTGVIQIADDDTDEARSIVLSHLLSGAAVEVELRIVGADLAVEILGATDLFDGAFIVSDVDSALRSIEAELIERTRLFEMANAESLTQFRGLVPEEPMAQTLFVVRGATDEQIARLGIVIAQGQKVGISALIIGEASTLPNADEYFSLNQSEAIHVVDLIAEERNWQSGGQTATTIDTEPFVIPNVEVDGELAIRLNVFGQPRLIFNGVEIQDQLRAKSIEVLAFLALRPNGAATEVVGAALWPEANAKQVGERLATSCSNVRALLRRMTSSSDKFIERTRAGYQLDATRISVDLWDFELALTDVIKYSGDAKAKQIAFEQTVAIYEQHFCESAPYEWADDVREHLRRRAIDAYTLLAETYVQTSSLTAAADILERAIELDGVREDLYQRLMRVQCDLEQFGAATRTGELLSSRLEDLNLEPSETTMWLLADARRSQRKPLAS